MVHYKLLAYSMKRNFSNLELRMHLNVGLPIEQIQDHEKKLDYDR
jgi:hypothetical protein